MKSLNLEEKIEIKKALKDNSNSIVQNALRKIIEKNERVIYSRDKKRIKEILRKAFKQKQNVKIQYYSLSSDETRYRTVSIYEFREDWIIAYCHLRKEERTFVTKHILAAALLKDTYKIPRNWQPTSIVRSGR